MYRRARYLNCNFEKAATPEGRLQSHHERYSIVCSILHCSCSHLYLEHFKIDTVVGKLNRDYVACRSHPHARSMPGILDCFLGCCLLNGKRHSEAEQNPDTHILSALTTLFHQLPSRFHCASSQRSPEKVVRGEAEDCPPASPLCLFKPFILLKPHFSPRAMPIEAQIDSQHSGPAHSHIVSPESPECVSRAFPEFGQSMLDLKRSLNHSCPFLGLSSPQLSFSEVNTFQLVPFRPRIIH